MNKERNFKTYALMWKTICYKPMVYIIDCILWALIHLSPLVPGLIAREFFNMLSGNANINIGIWGLVALIIITALVRIVLIYWGVYADILFRFLVSSLLRRNILKQVFNHPGANSISASQGEALNCLRDDVDQAENAVDWTIDVIGTSLFTIVAVIILLNINAKITIFVFAPIVVVLAIAHGARKKVQKYRKASRAASSKVSGAIGEIFNSIQAIKVSGSEEHIVNNFRELNKNRHKLMLKDTLLTQLLNSIFQNTVSFGTGLTLLLAAQSMKSGNFTVGDFSLFIYYLGFVTDFTEFFGNFIAVYQQTGIAFQRMISILKGISSDKLVEYNPIYLKENIPEVKYNIKIGKNSLENLEVKDLTYIYEGSNKGIENISFSLKSNTFTVITGRIGSGKTTLLRTLLGLLNKNSGNIRWNDKTIEDPSAFFVFPHSAYTAQIPHLFSDTILNNILLGLKKEKVDINKAAYSAVLEQDLSIMEKGLDTIVGPRGVKLSGGQIQRVATARMFARNAELFVFDDISSALDVNTERLLWTRLFERKKVTCLVASNRKAALQHADHIIVLKDGHVEAQGKLKDLLESCEEMQQIWENA